MGFFDDLFDSAKDALGGLPGLGSSIFDDFFGKSASDRSKKGYGQAFGFQKQKEAFLNELFGKLESSINEGYGAAFGEIANLSETGRQGILAREQQQLGGANQSLASRGLGNTTVVEAANRGIASDTDMALRDLSQAMAGLRSNLKIGQASALGNAYMGRYAALSDIYDTRSSLALGRSQLSGGTLGEWLGGGGLGDLASLFGVLSG